MQFIDNSYIKDPIVHSLSLFEKNDVQNFLDVLSRINTPVSLGFVNQYAYNLCCQSSAAADDFSALTYKLRDGSGVNLACILNACNPGVNLNGTDFIPLLVQHIIHTHQAPQFFVFGTKEPWLGVGSQHLLGGNNFVSVGGFESEDAYIDTIAATNAQSNGLRVVILAMGMPKQERIARKILAVTDGPVLVVCGGAIIDFCAGRFSRAPQLFRALGMEWLYRLCVEPKRLFKRYVLGIPIFFYYIFKNKYGPCKT